MQTPDTQLFKLMADRVQDYAIFLLDTTGHIMSWNLGAATIKQYSAAEVIGKHFSLFYTQPDIDREWPAQELKAATIEGRFEDEGWRVRKDGSRFWANVIITALRDDHGELLAFSKITRDLTDRKRHEETLRQSEERFRLLVEGVQDYAIYMLSPEGVVTSWNRGARRIKGYTADEIVGKHFSRFYSQDQIEAGRPWAELAVARETGRAEDQGWRVRKDGSRFWARVAVTALHDTDGTLRGFAKVTQDMTQQLHAKNLEESAANINNFIAILAHELRNPLAPIRNAVQLQNIAKPGDPAHRRATEIIERQSAQLSRIVDDLLDITRISKGTMKLTRGATNFEAVVQRAVETAQPAISASKHKLHVDLPKESIQVEADELRLNQAITNLLVNAARYTEPGGEIFVSVRVQSGAGGRWVRLSVRDTGKGIEPGMLDAIFGMFVQGTDILNRPAAGLGVGLALARSIVELHHGTLEARSDGEGKGAEFIIKLPVKEAVIPEKSAPVAQVLAAPALQEAPNCRVLVVDDNEDAANSLRSLLKEHGFEAQAVYSGADAIDVSEGFRPEVILLDIGMPGMNGLEVARRLRERKRKPSPYIVAVTGWGNPDDEARSLEAGFDLHLVKPLDEERLLEAIAGRGRRTLH